jgi:hypothetical protein
MSYDMAASPSQQSGETQCPSPQLHANVDVFEELNKIQPQSPSSGAHYVVTQSRKATADVNHSF